MCVPNGDYLAIDLASPEAPIVYLSHDGDDTYNLPLGANFADFIDRWTLLGCPGSEGWQMTPFLNPPEPFLNPLGDNANLWRQIFGLAI